MRVGIKAEIVDIGYKSVEFRINGTTVGLEFNECAWVNRFGVSLNGSNFTLERLSEVESLLDKVDGGDGKFLLLSELALATSSITTRRRLMGEVIRGEAELGDVMESVVRSLARQRRPYMVERVGETLREGCERGLFPREEVDAWIGRLGDLQLRMIAYSLKGWG
jgi:hypothetical protein